MSKKFGSLSLWFLSFLLLFIGCIKKESLELTVKIRDINYLSPNEIGLDIIMENKSNKAVLINYLIAEGGGVWDECSFFDVLIEGRQMKLAERLSDEKRDPFDDSKSFHFIMATKMIAVLPNKTWTWKLIASTKDNLPIKNGNMLRAAFNGPICRLGTADVKTVKGILNTNQIDISAYSNLNYKFIKTKIDSKEIKGR